MKKMHTFDSSKRNNEPEEAMPTPPLPCGAQDRNGKRVRKKFLQAAVFFLNKSPPLKTIVFALMRKYRVLYYKRKSKTNKNVIAPDVDKIYWIDPDIIRYISAKEFDASMNQGKTLDGDWDLPERPFEKLTVFIAFQERFTKGKEWEQTIYYNRILEKIHNGEHLWNSTNKEELDKRFRDLDTFYADIKKNGYKLQQEFSQEKKDSNQMISDDEITVNIGRDGDLLLNNGAHRLAIVKILKIRKIPVKITVRHEKWMEFKNQILLYAKDQKKEKIYAPLLHIDLQDIRSFHDDSEERFNIIRNNLTATKGRLLDLGTNWGYFCNRFEEIGFKCYAVEYDQSNLYFLKRLKRANNKKFQVIEKSIFNIDEIEKKSFDVVLALNIFHHFLKNEKDHTDLVHFLQKLKVKELYFQPQNPEEPQMKDAYKNYPQEEFVHFIIDYSTLTNFKKIYDDVKGRHIYKIY